ncbi:MAG: zinc ribbon domain-containing protein [Methanomassiliicoccaceae archaeon]|jgi:RNA polymerase subunit RPABC4/transcription elongation factor Spt4|nr:zinc ribbon domain-containing protein [Methanomassiliicoccaceae archaeon]
MIIPFIASMDEYQKTGFQKFRETKAAIPVGIALALLVSFALVAVGFVDMLGGLCIAIFAYFILRLFRVRDIRYLLITAALMFIIFTAEIYLLPKFVFTDDPTVFRIMSNVFVVLVLPFLVLSLLTWWMRQNLEKTRARMEKEGRLYPQGYGRCKKCGSLVLPGEVICRKCGEYIDVPEDLRVKKVNYFECSECGREVPKDAGVCPYCGEAFEDDDTKQA